MEEAKWYVVHTYSGYENKVRDDILKSVKNRNLQDQVVDVVVPLETVDEYKNGEAKKTVRKKLPCYVLINMVLTDESWYVVRNTRGVTGFVGPGSKPVALTPEEIAKLGFEVESAAEEAVVVFEGNVGDEVRILDPSWEGTVGVIKEINTGKKTVTVNVVMFNRDTSVEVDFSNVEIINE